MEYDEIHRRYPRFTNLMEAYFNYDWRDDFDSYSDVYAELVDDTVPYIWAELAAEIRAVQAQFTTDDEIMGLLVHIGSGFDPRHDANIAPVQWLTELSHYVDSWVRKGSN
jgi:hypothetical protein